MKYEVPAYRINKLVKLIKRAQNKGGKISFNNLKSFNKKIEIAHYDYEKRRT